jgi:hypothetical protein
MKTHYIPLALLVLAFAFPPCDYVIPADPVEMSGQVRLFTPSPEQRSNSGFLFINSVGGRQQIRYPQWLIQMGVLAGLAYFLQGRSAK